MTLVVDHDTLRIPVLTSERLRMRAPRASDFDAYAAFCASDRSVGVGGPYDRAQSLGRFLALTGHWSFHGYGRWLVADLADDVPLGVVGLMNAPGWPEPEIAWSLFAPAEGRGIGLEAARLARRYAYEALGWSTVISCTVPDNLRSQALARRMGAVEESRFEHPTIGEMIVWRHLGPDALRAADPDVAAASASVDERHAS